MSYSWFQIGRSWLRSPPSAPSARRICWNTSMKSARPCRPNKAAATWLRCNVLLLVSDRQKLAEVAALRAKCQANMLEHFYEVSQAMPPEQGRRYLAEMQCLTLGFRSAEAG